MRDKRTPKDVCGEANWPPMHDRRTGCGYTVLSVIVSVLSVTCYSAANESARNIFA